MFEDDYFKQRCREALKGNRASAADVLSHIEELLAQGLPLSPAAVCYLRIAIRRIFEGADAAKALGLAHRKRGRPKNSREQDYLILAAEIELRVRRGEKLTDAYNAVSKKYGQKVRTIERAWQEEGPVQYFLDDELDIVLDPPSADELKSSK